MLYDRSENYVTEYVNIMNDVVYSEEWYYIEKDSLFEVMNNKYKMLYRKGDTIKLQHIDTTLCKVLINSGSENPSIMRYYKDR